MPKRKGCIYTEKIYNKHKPMVVKYVAEIMVGYKRHRKRFTSKQDAEAWISAMLHTYGTAPCPKKG